ncbi:MAG: 6,7-dimethyl-8-ribityllumazine synthase, partial [Bacteroidetes bacterium]
MRIGIVVAEWNQEITEALYRGAYDSLVKNGAMESDIIKEYVPGSFELPLGAQLLIENHKPDAIICL